MTPPGDRSMAEDAFRGVLWTSGGRIATQFVGVLFGIFLARLLSPEQFGLVGMIAVVTGFATLFSDLGLGAAWHDGELETSNLDKKSLGSRILFRIPFEVGLTLYGPHRISIMFDHVSNGHLASPNEGLDTLGLRYSYLFK